MINWPLIALLISVLAGAGGAWLGMDYKEKSMLAEVQREKDAYEKGMLLVAGELAKKKVVQNNTTQVLEKQIVEKIVYRDAKHDQETFDLLNKALLPPGSAK
jgi:hypothetical protein